MGKSVQFSEKHIYLFWGDRHLTFSHGHVILCAIVQKGFDEDGQTKRSPESRWLVRIGVFQSKDPSLPSRRTEQAQLK